MIKKAILLFNTVRYLKLKQLKYQIIYRLGKPKNITAYLDDNGLINNVCYLNFSCLPPVYQGYNERLNEFTFLNLGHKFEKEVDWSYQAFGKLWNYNLQYLNYIHQQGLSFNSKVDLIESVYKALKDNIIPLEPYPASLRAINVLRFVNYYPNFDGRENVLENLYAEFNFISKRLEFHLLANHLLENLFSLMMGGAFFNNFNWVKKAKFIIERQLEEQILNDGAHFELSPMYHQIILFRLLELIDWYSNWDKKERVFLNFLKEKAERMLGWLNKVTFTNGDIPHLNDSSNGIAYSSNWLINYGKSLNLKMPVLRQLSDSGYRCFNLDDYECRVDVGPIGANYQPGHAHADAFNFVLYKGGNPVIVDLGTSTYEIGNRRNLERGTTGHNTVTINNADQSQVWGGFRVGRRAKASIIEENDNSIIALHDGYKKTYGVLHQRSFTFGSDKILINDEILGDKDNYDCAIARYYFDPSCLNENHNESPPFISFVGANKIELKPYKLANGYNKFEDSFYLEVSFKNKLNTTIDISNIKK